MDFSTPLFPKDKYNSSLSNSILYPFGDSLDLDLEGLGFKTGFNSTPNPYSYLDPSVLEINPSPFSLYSSTISEFTPTPFGDSIEGKALENISSIDENFTFSSLYLRDFDTPTPFDFSTPFLENTSPITASSESIPKKRGRPFGRKDKTK